MSSARDLILGYGSTLRGDDQAGPVAAERLAREGYHAFSLPQLAPELAERVAASARVVFVDAAVDVPPGEVAVREIEAAPEGQPLEHQAGPRSLLALARECYGWQGRAWLVALGVESFHLGEPLTAAGRQAVELAVETVRAVLGPTSSPTPGARPCSW